MGVVMKSKFTFLLSFTLILLLSISTTCAQESEEHNSLIQNYPKVTLFGTESRILHSDIVDQEFELYISLPNGYANSDTTYPVLFSLDANRSYGVVNNMVNVLSFPHNEIPELIVVGVGYPIIGLADWVIGRNRDFTPTSKPEYDKQWVDRLSQATGTGRPWDPS